MKVSRSAILPYSAVDMYRIVADIDVYPQFLNWCTGVERISTRGVEAPEPAQEEVVAKLKISYSKLNFSFTTKNRNTPFESIEMSLVDGPFSELSGMWTFVPLNQEACKASIEMDFEFDSSIAQAMMGRVFQRVIAAQLDAFQQRAQQLHGEADEGHDRVNNV